MEVSASRLLRTIENINPLVILQLLRKRDIIINVYIPTDGYYNENLIITKSHKQNWYSYTINSSVKNFLKSFENLDGIKIKLSEKEWKYLLDCEKKLTKKEI